MSSKIPKTTGKEKSAQGPTPGKKASLAGRSRYEQTLARRRRRRIVLIILAVIGVAILSLGVIFFQNNNNNGAGNGQASQYPFQVGNPGPGAQAPATMLPATDGSTFDLASQKGKTVLLYFQEGLTCQPCWDQIKDIQSNMSQFRGLGIDRIVSITTDPLDQIKQKVSDQGISIPVLSDPRLAVSQAYSANSYGMMGNSRDGHTFVLVGPDGHIKWRADYGGSPNYTMYVPVPNLLADLKTGIQGK